MKPLRLRFARDDHGKTLDALGYEQINAHARFVFDKPLTITPRTVIEYDSINGTFYKISADEHRELLSGKWDR